MRKGFTLAEVLITLAAIGVVAALAIPALLSNTNKSEFVIAAKKAYVTLDNALKMAAINNGTPNDIQDLFSTTNVAVIGNAIVNTMSVSKNCANTTTSDCSMIFNQNYDGSNATNIDRSSNYYYKFITNDGMMIYIESYGSGFSYNCSRDYGINNNSPTKYTCGQIFIDVNGKKGPNYLGRDVFSFYMTSHPQKGIVLYPTSGVEDNAGGGGSSDNVAEGQSYWNKSGNNMCSSSGSKIGNYCTGRLMEKSWVIDY